MSSYWILMKPRLIFTYTHNKWSQTSLNTEKSIRARNALLTITLCIMNEIWLPHLRTPSVKHTQFKDTSLSSTNIGLHLQPKARAQGSITTITKRTYERIRNQKRASRDWLMTRLLCTQKNTYLEAKSHHQSSNYKSASIGWHKWAALTKNSRKL